MSLTLASPLFIYLANITLAGAMAALLYAGRRSVREQLDQLKDKMDLETSTDDGYRLALVGVTAAALTGLSCVLFGMSPWLALALAALAGVGAPLHIARQKHRRYREAFDKTLVESLTTVASSLRAGLTLKDALGVAADNCPAPFSTETRRLLREYNLGLSLDEALDNLRTRIGTVDTKIAFGAIMIGAKLGGRLPEILTKIVHTIRERERVEGRLKALTAQGRSQAFLLCAAPPLLAVGLYFYDPIKMGLMTGTTVGQLMLSAAAVLEVIGIAVTLKIMKLDV